MNRTIVYPGAIPQDTDILNAQRAAMINDGMLASAVAGTSTWVYGLSCIPTSPTADLNVHVLQGCIGQQAVVDQSAFGSLPADTVGTITKIGVNEVTTNFAITPPSTSGYSQNYLIECQMQEADGTPVVLPYYNAANPAAPYSGPSNSGTAQNTVRGQIAALQLKAGTPAPAGTQVTPGVDSGWVPLWVISVNNGQTQITSANIAQARGAPFLSPLGGGRQSAMATLTFYVRAGGNDNNSGLIPGDALATVQAAVNLFNKYDLRGYQPIIDVGAGSFSGALIAGLLVGQTQNLLIRGAGSGSTTINGGASTAFAVGNGASVTVQGMTITGGNGITAGGATVLVGTDIIMGAATSGYKMFVNIGGVIQLAASYGDTGNAINHFNIQPGGQIQVFSGLTCTLSGTPTYTTFAAVTGGSFSSFGGTITFAGTGATGQRYSVTGGGFINTGGGGANYFPGSTAGTTGSGTNIGFYA